MIPNPIFATIAKSGISSIALDALLGSMTKGKSKGQGHGRRNNKTNNVDYSKLLKTTKKTKAKAKKKKINPADEIKKWHELLKMGAITQEEYDKKKKELLKI